MSKHWRESGKITTVHPFVTHELTSGKGTLQKPRISCRLQTRTVRCITANVLQTNKVDAQWDKLATEPSWQLIHVKSRQFAATAPAFNIPHLHLVPPLGVTPFEFCWDFQHQKTRVPGLSCGIVCMILRLAISVEHWLVVDRQTDRHNDS